MKIKTPMQTLRDHLKQFDLLTEQFDLYRKCFQYRKPKSNIFPYKDRKPINSDFLMVFFLEPYKPTDSFGFKFTFLDSKKKEVVKNQYFEINFKIDGEIYNSKIFSIEEAKNVLKFINKSLRETYFDKHSFFEFLKSNFMISEKEVSNNLINFEKEFNEKSEYLQNQVNKLKF